MLLSVHPVSQISRVEILEGWTRQFYTTIFYLYLFTVSLSLLLVHLSGFNSTCVVRWIMDGWMFYAVLCARMFVYVNRFELGFGNV